MRIECALGDDGGTHFLGYGGNFSETGMFVQCLAPRPEGTRLRLVLHVGGSNGTRICAEATVRWTRGYGGKKGPSAGMGVHFDGMAPSDRSVLLASCSVPVAVESAIIESPPRTERRNQG